MQLIVIEDHYHAWRDAALQALAQGWSPDMLQWKVLAEAGAQHDQGALDYGSAVAAGSSAAGASAAAPGVRISRELSELLQEAALCRDPQRWAFLYQVLWRWMQGQREVVSPADGDGARLARMAKSVRRDKHDMIAYVRFRKQSAGPDGHDGPEYVAWYAPQHDILPWAAEHFAQRMGRSSWMIATPLGAALWDGSALQLTRQHMLQDDQLEAHADQAEALWLTYYRSIFNPARLNESVLQQQMPVRYWKALPEAALIPGMVSAARNGERQLAQAAEVGRRKGRAIAIDAAQAQPLRELPSSLDACRRCDLWHHATQAVPGAGPAQARIMVIGEQPGDQEDLAGKAFVGPAGQVLDAAIGHAGLVREQLYLTNAVKHFKWEPRGKRRMHKTASQREVEACFHWLERELDSVKPAVIVTLGATALSALLQQRTSLRDHLDAPFEIDGMTVIATYHPSFALRQPDPEQRDKVVDAIVAALEQARKRAAQDHPG
ncbi:UdgX family uracil-DNA binding protein [Herbaspirillum sp. YR522]|uniref:UdgX family uracil-DNA binding protein n=1 Tax=Herbaspirillum sp. YR522 TaxID=1144342 RepID=UPI00026F7737|nr:UdgX family uracil-DNA binding protein [Herbaspirillum sp. YR522]EJM96384.1 uracil-DNA glycosylase, family 4 [Herbaspirillum sp. YR522]